ncbi:uncharacterized protein LOC119092111 [Pollicipes pollicipes]|uniref:uncharacterized protein LOC119092111 n=1 Tax=Pollicipes pollicipes TaxID=41117 RepID=UPI001884F206|nr:uncharacterized protein LOC119092111 [Pollicipes pollicipes]
MNPYFRKGSKAKNGSGHLWTLANVEGRRVRRSYTAARMGRPDRKVPWEMTLDLCDDISSPAQDIWLCSTAEDKENMPVTAGYGADYLTYVPEAMASTDVSLEESAERVLAGTGSHVEVQLMPPLRHDRVTSEALLGDYQMAAALQS